MDIISPNTPVETSMVGNSFLASPFLKWAGGKGQLLDTIDENLPARLKEGLIQKYFEPMVGAGALFFFVAQKYRIPYLCIGDRNEELILAYRAIQKDPRSLLQLLGDMQTRYYKLSKSKQEAYFYEVRSRFNERKAKIDLASFSSEWTERAAQIIYLNKTCFNGLFRVNSKGHFNVPFGRYDNPAFCSPENILAASEVLRQTDIRVANFSDYLDATDGKSFVYFDPPYRQLNKTSSFTAYSRSSFNDSEQLRLADFFRALDNKGASLMLSNSDPKNHDPNDNFFDDAYSGFHIKRVSASRMINSKAKKRSDFRAFDNELLGKG